MPIFYKKGGGDKRDCNKPKIWNPNTKRCVNDVKANRNKGANTATQSITSVVAVAPVAVGAKKICPQGKIFNPKTNRCINDTPANRKKINKEVIANNVLGSHLNIMTTQCSSYSNIKDVDISKFKFIDISNKTEAQLKLNVSGKSTITKYKLVYDDPKTNKQISLYNNKFLNKGAYGSVYEYYNKNYKVAVKYFKNKNDSELKVVQKLNKLKLGCKTINARVLERGKGAKLEKYVIMEIMHGSLDKMNGKLDINTVWNVIKDIAEHLKCLNDNKLAYTDLKTKNVLFKCKNKKEIDIYLGDLGSICNRGQTHVSTWMPWETSRGWVHGVKCNELTMVWQLAVVFLELMDWRKYNLFSWENIKNYTPANMTRYFNEIIALYKLDTLVFKDNENSKFKNAGDLFRGMVQFRPMNRCKLIDITTSIKL